MIENTSLIALSRQSVLRREMDVIANNVANASTTGFRRQRMLFEEFLMDAGGGRKTSFVRDVGVVRDLTEGAKLATDNPLDMAISGEGYFSVDTEDGIRYTRNGRFRLDEEGTLVTIDGNPVLDADQRPILLNPGDGTVDIAPDGTITTDEGDIGVLGIVTFDNLQAVKASGGGLYETDQAPKPAEESSVRQGMIEGSNVEPILEMTRMINVLRAYQSTQDLVQKDGDMRRRSIERLAKVN